MTQLEKKCLIASASAHSALALLLMLGPLLWVTRPHQISLPVLTFIPTRLVDGATGGGSPQATTPPLAPPAPPVELTPPEPIAPQPEPKPEPKPIKPEPIKPEPVMPEPKATPKPRDFVPAKQPVKQRIQISTNKASVKRSKSADTRAQREASARAARERHAARVSSILGAIQQGVSSSTTIEVPGPGGGAYADYGQWVVEVYRQAWTPPGDLADELATVTAEVVIARRGNVESFKLTSPSGHAALDKSVDRLESVSYVAPFPEGARDDRRSFRIDFNLRSKR